MLLLLSVISFSIFLGYCARRLSWRVYGLLFLFVTIAVLIQFIAFYISHSELPGGAR